MALIVEFICELPNGVHARPASHVETLCNTFSSQIIFPQPKALTPNNPHWKTV